MDNIVYRQLDGKRFLVVLSNDEWYCLAPVLHLRNKQKVKYDEAILVRVAVFKKHYVEQTMQTTVVIPSVRNMEQILTELLDMLENVTLKRYIKAEWRELWYCFEQLPQKNLANISVVLAKEIVEIWDSEEIKADFKRECPQFYAKMEEVQPWLRAHKAW